MTRAYEYHMLCPPTFHAVGFLQYFVHVFPGPSFIALFSFLGEQKPASEQGFVELLLDKSLFVVPRLSGKNVRRNKRLEVKTSFL